MDLQLLGIMKAQIIIALPPVTCWSPNHALRMVKKSLNEE